MQDTSRDWDGLGWGDCALSRARRARAIGRHRLVRCAGCDYSCSHEQYRTTTVFPHTSWRDGVRGVRSTDRGCTTPGARKRGERRPTSHGRACLVALRLPMASQPVGQGGGGVEEARLQKLLVILASTGPPHVSSTARVVQGRGFDHAPTEYSVPRKIQSVRVRVQTWTRTYILVGTA